jgi:hypothetical protein
MSRELESYVAAAASLAGLELSVESRAGVTANLAILLRMAEAFESEPLDPHLDPLPTYRP